MRSNKKRIRIDYAPLNVAVSVECFGAPTTQVYSTVEETTVYNPNRLLQATILCPKIEITTSDNSWTSTDNNALLLEDRVWYVNGIPISEHPDWKEGNPTGDPKDYIIERPINSENGIPADPKGTINIYKNVFPGVQYSLQFKGEIYDSRLGTRIPIITDPIILSTVVKSEDACSISIEDDSIITYDPFKDKLSLYEYKVANGFIAASEQNKQDATDKYSYLHTIPIHLYQAGTEKTSGYTYEVYDIDGNKLTVENSPEIVAITSSSITIDLRLIKKKDFIIKAIIDSSTIKSPQVQFSVNRKPQSFKINPTNGTSILPSDIIRTDSAMVSTKDSIVEYPESIIKIEWYTDTDSIKNLMHNEGVTTSFAIADTGIGSLSSDNWLDVYCDAEVKQEYSVATDENGNIFTDEDGNPYIFN